MKTLVEKPNWNIGHSGESRKYTCGYCGESISSDLKPLSGGATYATEQHSRMHADVSIFICHECGKPTYFDWDGTQHPGSSPGNSVEGIDDPNVEAIYNEARNCMKVNAYTGATLCCRKLLMNVAVSKGAGENLKFIQYVDYLHEKNYAPNDSSEWVSHIKNVGNEATHEIPQPSKEDAEELIVFSEMLLKLIYEFPARMRAKRGG